VSGSVARLTSARAFVVPAVAFVAFGGLVGWRIGNGWVPVVLGFLVGALFGLLAGAVMIGVLGVANPRVARDTLREAAGTGFLLVLPFAALAAAAELLLGWNASQTFSSAGLMTSAATIGMEVGRRGGRGLRAALFPTITAFVLASLWAIVSVGAASVIGK
jgi:hypothetical protein